MSDPIEFLTPVGRIVQGHPMKQQAKTDKKTKQPKLGRDGKPLYEYFCALAIPKPQFEQHLRQWFDHAARTFWPQGQWQRRDFAWKFVDGDSTEVNQANRRWCDYEGYPGHFVLSLRSGFAYQIVAPDGVTPIVDETKIKCGDFARAYIRVNGNAAEADQKPGLYLNPQFLQLMGYGEQIRGNGQIDAVAVIRAAGAPPPLPPGANPVPVAPGAASQRPAPAPLAAHQPPPPPPPPPRVAPAATWPPAGWTAHPDYPGYFYSGDKCLSEADLRALGPTPPRYDAMGR